MSEGKPITEEQLNEVLDILNNLTGAVENLAGAVKHLLSVSKLQNRRIETIEAFTQPIGGPR